MNQGYVGTEIAEMMEMPPGLDAAWHAHGYYGSVSHNVKAIYQRYLGWYDGNPAHLWLHPPVAAAERYVQVIGGVDATVAKAITFLEKGDLRFAAELASHAVFAAPDSETARQVLCTALTELGYGSECATWRNCFLVGAQELFHPIEHTEVSSAGMAPALTVTQLFDSIAIRINGPKAWNETLRINWAVTAGNGGGGGDGSATEHYRMELSNGVLIHFPTALQRGGRPHGHTDQGAAGRLAAREAGPTGSTCPVTPPCWRRWSDSSTAPIPTSRWSPPRHRVPCSGGVGFGAAGDLVGPQFGRHRHRPTMRRRAVGAGVAVGEGRGGDPALEGLLVAPAGHDEPLAAVVGGAQQLEALEALLVVHGPGAGGEAAGQLVAGVGGHRDGVDLDDGHGPI